ncbi:MAG: hybrid sensory histidine kinase BarA [Candidatus Syntrophoarchaeum sp. GoM_oil]|nr:MAG: hybrid sensory histidine kinase BarA [Candidatus Syntrophoarchaeum sp. GoM_oil]
MKMKELLKKESMKLYITVCIGFSVIGILIALNEILDLPHLIFGAVATPLNWIDVAIESVFVFIIFLFSLHLLRYIFLRFETTLKKLEAAEREVANVWKQQEGFLDAITEPTITIAPNFDIIYINDAALSLTGYRREEIDSVLGAKCYRVFKPKNNDCKGTNCILRNMPDEVLSLKNIDRTIVTRDGTEIEGLLSCARVRDAEGNILGGMEIFRDVREERRRLREIEESENELAIMNEELRTTNEEVIQSQNELLDVNKKLQESEERFRSIAETANDAIISIDSNATIVFCNDAAETIFGYSCDEIIKKPVILLLPERSRPTFKDSINQAVLSGRSYITDETVDFMGLRKNGSEFPADHSVSKWKTRDGSIFFTVIIRDITERSVAERKIQTQYDELDALNNQLAITIEELKTTNEYLIATQEMIEHQRRLLESYSNVIRVLNSEIDLDRLIEKTLDSVMEFTKSQIGRVYLYDPNYETLKLHTSYGTAMGKNEELKLGEGLAGEAARKQSLVILEEENDELQIITLTGSVSPITNICIPVVYQDELLAVVGLGSINRFDEDLLAFIEDFTIQYATAIKNAMTYRSIQGLANELADRNKEIEEANKEIQRANEMKSEFLAKVSHELRTPMTSILGFTKRVMKKSEGVLPEKEIKQLEIVYRNGEELLNLVNGLLDLSKIESGQIELDIEDFNINDLVDDVVDLAIPLAEDKGLRIVKEAEAVELTSDKGKIKEMLVNLVGNAIKFTDNGEVRLVAETQNEDHITLIVEDTGIGVSEEDLESIFDEFKQVGCGSRKRHGTGLGLAITKKYAEMLGEGIKVESEVSKGTKFTMQLKKHIVNEGAENE